MSLASRKKAASVGKWIEFPPDFLCRVCKDKASAKRNDCQPLPRFPTLTRFLSMNGAKRDLRNIQSLSISISVLSFIVLVRDIQKRVVLIRKFNRKVALDLCMTAVRSSSEKKGSNGFPGRLERDQGPFEEVKTLTLTGNFWPRSFLRPVHSLSSIRPSR